MENIINDLRDRIARHKLPPGSKLREGELAEEYKVSRARIRDVFSALEQRGLIERIPNRGAVVIRLDADQVFDLYNIREVLEGLMARLATRNAPKGAWDDLIRKFGEPLEKAVAERRYDLYLGAVGDLNQRMLLYARNDLLSTFLDLIQDKTQVYARRAIVLPGRAEVGLELHRKLLKAMAAGNTAEAERTKHEIIAGAREYLEKYRDFVL